MIPDDVLKKMTPEEARLILLLAMYRAGSNYGANFLDKTTRRFWIHKLRSQRFEAVQEALKKLSGFPNFPTANEVLREIHNSRIPDPDQAFEWLWRNLNRTRIPSNLDLVLARTIDQMGGWIACCDNWREDRRDEHRAKFIRAYRKFADEKARNMDIGTSQYALESSGIENMGNTSSSDPKWKKIANSEGEQKKIAMTSRDKNGGTLGDLINSFREGNNKLAPPKPRTEGRVSLKELLDPYMGGGNEHKTP